MKAITAFFVLAISGCISVANSQSGGTPTWEDLWAADDAKCRRYGHDPVIAAKDYVDCRGEFQEQRGNKWREIVVKRKGQPAETRTYTSPMSTCSTSSDAAPC